MTDDAPARSFLCVEIAAGRYGISTECVVEVAVAPPATPVPHAPSFVAGVVSYRGSVIPIIDAARRLCGDEAPAQRAAKMVIVEGAHARAGLLVDSIVSIVRLGPEAIDSTPGVLADGDDCYEGIGRVGDKLLGLLNVPRIVDFTVTAPKAGAQPLESIGAAPGGVAERAPRAAERRRFAVVRIADESYAVDADAVVEVLSARPVERPGRLPDYVLGLLPHRQGSLPVVDLVRRLKPRAEPADAATGKLVVLTGGGGCALRVDEVVELVLLAPDDIRPVPDIIHGGKDHVQALAIDGPNERVLVVLEAERIIKPEHVNKLQELGRTSMQSGSKEQDGAAIADTELLIFQTGDIDFALVSSQVREVLQPPLTTWVPFAPPFVTGVFHLRGEVLPVIDLRARLGLGAAAADRRGKVVVMVHDGWHYALLVDGLREIRRVPRAAIAPAPAIVQGVERQYLVGIVPIEGRTVLLLGPTALCDKDILLQTPSAEGQARRPGEGDEASDIPEGVPPVPSG